MKASTRKVLAIFLSSSSIAVLCFILLTNCHYNREHKALPSEFYHQQLPPDRYGRQRHRKDIIKGDETDSIANYPYTVSLLDENHKGQTWHTCGGCLITPNVVLTAAHCKKFVKIALVGHHATDHYKNVNTLVKRSDMLILDESESIIHPKYNAETTQNDFLLYKLPISITETPFVNINSNPLIPTTYGGVKDRKLTVLGWGLTIDGEDTSSSEVLMKAKLSYIENYQCGSKYGYKHIKRSMMCAHSNKGRDACKSDSGGPLIMQHGNGPEQDLLVGIVSWGKECGSYYYPGVYGRVSSAYDWINKVVCNQLDPNSCDANGIMKVNRVKQETTPESSLSLGITTKKETKGAKIIGLDLGIPATSPNIIPEIFTTATMAPILCQDFAGTFKIYQKKSTLKDCEWVNSNAWAKRWLRCRKFGAICPQTCGGCPQ